MINYKNLKYVVLMLLCIPFSTSAKTYYSDYSDFSLFSKEEVKESDLVEVEVEERYLGYKERLEYIKEDTPDKVEDVSYKNKRWVVEKPELILETKKIYTYYEYEDNRRIRIENDNYAELKIENLKYGTDLIIDEFVLRPGEEFIFDVPNNESTRKGLNFLCTSDVKSIKYSVYLYTDDVENKPVVVDLQSNINHSAVYPDALGQIFKEEYELEEERDIFGEVKVREEYLTADAYYLTKFKDYTDEYFKEETEDYKIDLTQKQLFYRFKTREMLNIKNNIIEDSKTLVDDLIESTTDYKIVSDINYKVNGKYDLNVITPYGTFKEEIVVNNPENVKLLVKNLTENLEETKQALDLANYQVEVKNQEIKEVVNESNDTFLETENEKLKTELTETKEIKKDLDTVDIKKSSTIIGIFLMLLLLLVPLLKREKNV